MKTALIGYTWFVWSNILDQMSFDDLYNSKNIQDIQWKEYDQIICAWVSAVKWWSNQNPEEDLAWIESLMQALSHVECKKFILISTVDVYPNPRKVDEDFDFSSIQPEKYHAYWRNRLFLEKFIHGSFPWANVIRLPWLFGNGLKKNIIYDLMNNHMTENIIPNFRLQYYNLSNISKDIQKTVDNNISTINFNSEPIESSEIIALFSHVLVWEELDKPIVYDYYTKYARIFSGKWNYMYTKQETLSQIRDFIFQNTNL